MTERPAIEFPDGFLWGAATASYQIEGAAREGGRGTERVGHVLAHRGQGRQRRHGRRRLRPLPPRRRGRRDDGRPRPADVPLLDRRGRGSCPTAAARSTATGIALLPPARRAACSTTASRRARRCSTGTSPRRSRTLGGFRSRDTVSWFGDYAALMARELGDRVTMWSTFNEPWCYAYLGHVAGPSRAGSHRPEARPSPSPITSCSPTASRCRRCVPSATGCSSAS